MERIKYSGRGNSLQPFKIPGQTGYYYQISFESFERLQRINEAYRALCRGGSILDRIRVVGRGGIPGPHPFLHPALGELYLYILKEDLEKLVEINKAYRKALEAQRMGEEERREVEAEAPVENLDKTVEEIGKAELETLPREEWKELKGQLEGEGGVFKPENQSLALQDAQRSLELAEGVEKVKTTLSGKLYVYCLVPSSIGRVTFDAAGLEGGEVYTIPYGDLTAVVSDVSIETKEPTEENVQRHHVVVNRVTERYEVLPMAFGMVFRDEQRLGEVLNLNKRALREAFRRVEGKVELGIKVIRPKEGAQIDEEAFAADVKRFRSLAASAKLGRKVSGRVLLNVHYLVAKGDVERFSEEVERLIANYPKLKIHYTGPWPPYNFTTIRIGRKG